MASITPEIRRVLKTLKDYDVVKNVSIHYHHIGVEYITGIKESWMTRPGKNKKFSYKFPSSGWFKKDVPIYYEYETNPLKDDNSMLNDHFIIQHKDVKKAGFCDKHIVIHQLVNRLLKEGWIEPVYPLETLDKDRKSINGSTADKYVKSGHITMYPQRGSRQIPGRILASHFLQWGDFADGDRDSLRDGWSCPVSLFRAITALLRKKKDVTRYEIIRIMAERYGPRFISPLFYKGLIDKYFKIKKPVVLDIDPRWGSKALATAMLGGVYYHKPFLPFDRAADKVAEYVDSEFYLDDGSSADIAFTSDGRCMPAGMLGCALSHIRGRADIIVGFTDDDNIDAVRKQLNPTNCVRAQLLPPAMGRVDWMVIWEE